LTIPIGAIVIDTTELTIDEVVSEVIRHIEATI
jgi:cytidylate kinase